MGHKLSPLHQHVADTRIFGCDRSTPQQLTDERIGLLCTIALRRLGVVEVDLPTDGSGVGQSGRVESTSGRTLTWEYMVC